MNGTLRAEPVEQNIVRHLQLKDNNDDEDDGDNKKKSARTLPNGSQENPGISIKV